MVIVDFLKCASHFGEVKRFSVRFRVHLRLGHTFAWKRVHVVPFPGFSLFGTVQGDLLSFTNKLTLAGFIVTPLNLENSRNTHLLL